MLCRVFATILILGLPNYIYAASDSHYDPYGVDQYGNSRYADVDTEDYRKSWGSLDWKSEGKSFFQVRQAINSLNDKKQVISKIKLWEKSAVENPQNATFQFRYVIAAYMVASGGKSRGETNKNLLRKLSWHLSLPENPRAYEYDRMRFILLCDYAPYVDLLPLGKRLLAKSPDDADIKYWVGRLRVNAGDRPYMEQLVQEAKKDVAKYPNDAEKRRRLAGCYFQLWGLTKRRLYSQAAVVQYKEFLRLYPDTPQNAERRKKIQGWVEAIPKDQARWEKQGIGKPY